MIKNITKNKVLVNNSRTCDSDWSKSVGLMFSREKEDFGLIFPFPEEKKIPLHMFFVFYPIDVLFLDKNKKVVELKKNFRPFTFYTSKKKVKYVLELPSNNVVNTGTGINDKIDF